MLRNFLELVSLCVSIDVTMPVMVGCSHHHHDIDDDRRDLFGLSARIGLFALPKQKPGNQYINRSRPSRDDDFDNDPATKMMMNCQERGGEKAQQVSRWRWRQWWKHQTMNKNKAKTIRKTRDRLVNGKRRRRRRRL